MTKTIQITLYHNAYKGETYTKEEFALKIKQEAQRYFEEIEKGQCSNSTIVEVIEEYLYDNYGIIDLLFQSSYERSELLRELDKTVQEYLSDVDEDDDWIVIDKEIEVEV